MVSNIFCQEVDLLYSLIISLPYALLLRTLILGNNIVSLSIPSIENKLSYICEFLLLISSAVSVYNSGSEMKTGVGLSMSWSGYDMTSWRKWSNSK